MVLMLEKLKPGSLPPIFKAKIFPDWLFTITPGDMLYWVSDVRPMPFEPRGLTAQRNRAVSTLNFAGLIILPKCSFE